MNMLLVVLGKFLGWLHKLNLVIGGGSGLVGVSGLSGQVVSVVV